MKIKAPVWPDMETGQPMEWSDHQIYIITIMPPFPPFPPSPPSLSLECPMLGLVPTVTLHSQSAMRGQVCTWSWSPAPWSLTEEGWENPPRVSISSLSFLGFLSQCDSVTPCQLGTMVWCGNTTHLYSLREPHKQLILMKILQYNILLLQKKLLKMPALPFWILSSYEHN